ncbi:MAG TPA: sensor domain-containing diguanylate cyclase [Thermoanaerobaculia bacterium]|nr:sensor domain-containing diguanylate cyclase [Thermoanaerobaculia bacterium]
MITVLALSLFVIVACAAVLVDWWRAEATRFRLLVDLSERLQLSPTIGEATRLLPTFAARLFPRLEGVVYISDPHTRVVKLAVAWSGSAEEDTIAAADCNALLLGATHVATAQGESICEHAADDSDAETICIPIMDAGEPAGVMMLRARNRTPLPNGIDGLAKPFAHQIALALSNLRLQETLRAAAVRDSLTGLYNRRCISESVTLELLSGGDANARVGVILVDVDHFKRFNDTWGHGGGDALLQQFARLMQDIFRGEQDIICRYGGEEFVIVLPGITPDVLRSRAEQLLVRVRELRVNCDGHVTRITASAGIAISPMNANTIDALIAAADRALYAAKSAGRDRVATPPPQVAGRNAAAA